jgi:hypothetical protein
MVLGFFAGVNGFVDSGAGELYSRESLELLVEGRLASDADALLPSASDIAASACRTAGESLTPFRNARNWLRCGTLGAHRADIRGIPHQQEGSTEVRESKMGCFGLLFCGNCSE